MTEPVRPSACRGPSRSTYDYCIPRKEAAPSAIQSCDDVCGALHEFYAVELKNGYWVRHLRIPVSFDGGFAVFVDHGINIGRTTWFLSTLIHKK